jgi:hypothetical protein
LSISFDDQFIFFYIFFHYINENWKRAVPVAAATAAAQSDMNMCGSMI